jgi:hypothetical protein
MRQSLHTTGPFGFAFEIARCKLWILWTRRTAPLAMSGRCSAVLVSIMLFLSSMRQLAPTESPRRALARNGPGGHAATIEMTKSDHVMLFSSIMSDNDYAYHATPPLFRFGQDSAQFDAQSWRSPLNFNTSSSSLHPVSYGEEYDDVTELFELPDEDSLNEALRSQKDKNVRRRSSKGLSLTPRSLPNQLLTRTPSPACDQCRKSKCRCERSHPDDPCRNCEILGTSEHVSIVFPPEAHTITAECTFLGPSRKRGPPKVAALIPHGPVA